MRVPWPRRDRGSRAPRTGATTTAISAATTMIFMGLPWSNVECRGCRAACQTPPDPHDLSAAPARSRRVLPTLATVVGIAVFVAAGQWQQRRMHEKEALRAQQDAAALAAAARARSPARDATDWAALRYRHVSAAGTFDAQRQILIDNKVHDGRAGYHVVTPLALHGRPHRARRPRLDRAGRFAQRAAAVPPPQGAVDGRRPRRDSAARLSRARRDAATGPVWQNLDPARFAAATGLAVLPIVIEQTAPVRRRRRPRRATGPRPISASTSTGSTWCSGMRSRRSPRGLWLVLQLSPREQSRCVTASPASPERRAPPAAAAGRCC